MAICPRYKKKKKITATAEEINTSNVQCLLMGFSVLVYEISKVITFEMKPTECSCISLYDDDVIAVDEENLGEFI